MGVNKFADLTQEEFADIYLMKNLTPLPRDHSLRDDTPSANVKAVNWVD